MLYELLLRSVLQGHNKLKSTPVSFMIQVQLFLIVLVKRKRHLNTNPDAGWITRMALWT